MPAVKVQVHVNSQGGRGGGGWAVLVVVLGVYICGLVPLMALKPKMTAARVGSLPFRGLR